MVISQHLAWISKIDLLNDELGESNLELLEENANKAKEQEEEKLEPIVLQQVLSMSQQISVVS